MAKTTDKTAEILTPGATGADETNAENAGQSGTNDVGATGSVMVNADALADLTARLDALEAEKLAQDQKLIELEDANADLAKQLKAAKDSAANVVADDKALDAAAKRITRADREKFKTMHSSEVDATKLAAPVLCKDGWLAPDKSGIEAPAKR